MEPPAANFHHTPNASNHIPTKKARKKAIDNTRINSIDCICCHCSIEYK